MMSRNIPVLMVGTALVCAVPALAQQADPQVDLESVDSLLGGDDVSGEQPAPDTPAERTAESAPLPTEEVQPVEAPPAGFEAEPAPDPDAPVAELPVDEAPAPPERELSDLDRAYAAYSGCTSDAGRRLTEQGEAIEVVGVRALAACGEERAAYVNAFHFAQLPAPEGVEERALRLRAERLVSQTDTFLIAAVTEAASAMRNPAPTEPAPEAGDQANERGEP